MKKMVEFKSVSKTFAQKVALDSIDLKANRDKTTVLLGTSGCGKSTILKLIGGLISPNRGQVFFDKQEVNSEYVDEIRHRCGYVIQEGGLFPHL